MDSGTGTPIEHLQALVFSCAFEAMWKPVQTQAQKVFLNIIHSLCPAKYGVLDCQVLVGAHYFA
tara:strand:- start:241 stop:432 length:192 start_codon:yes stop_codon:yes gene_type:complete